MSFAVNTINFYSHPIHVKVDADRSVYVLAEDFGRMIGEVAQSEGMESSWESLHYLKSTLINLRMPKCGQNFAKLIRNTFFEHVITELTLIHKTLPELIVSTVERDQGILEAFDDQWFTEAALRRLSTLPDQYFRIPEDVPRQSYLATIVNEDGDSVGSGPEVMTLMSVKYLHYTLAYPHEVNSMNQFSMINLTGMLSDK